MNVRNLISQLLVVFLLTISFAEVKTTNFLILVYSTTFATCTARYLIPWQSFPLMVVGPFYIFISILENADIFPYLIKIFRATAILFIFVSAFLWVTLPVPCLPPPSGPHKVGVAIRKWKVSVMQSEVSVFDTPHAVEKEYSLKFFYPGSTNIQSSGVLSAPYMHSSGQFEQFFFPIFPSYIAHALLAQVETNGKSEIQISESKNSWNAILCSHGQGGSAEKMTSVCEELASHGYVVGVLFHEDWSRGYPGPVHRRLLDVYEAVCYLEKMNKNLGDLTFGGKLDFSNGIGIVGHSMGALTSLLTCTDEGVSILKNHARKLPINITCGVALDVWAEPFAEDEIKKKWNIQFPFLAFLNENWAVNASNKFEVVGNNSKNSIFFEIWFKGGFHQNGNDVPHLINPFFWGRANWIPYLGFEKNHVKHWPKLDISQDGKIHNKYVIKMSRKYFDLHFKNILGKDEIIRQKEHFDNFLNEILEDDLTPKVSHSWFAWKNGKVVMKVGNGFR